MAGRRRAQAWIVTVLSVTLLFEAGAVAPAFVVGAEPSPSPATSPVVPEPEPTPTPDEPSTDIPDAFDPADEVVAERTETSRTYDLGDGHQATELFADPLFYRPTDDGPLVAIEPGFRAVAGPDRAAVSDTAPARVTVAPADDPRGFVALEDRDGFRVAYRPLIGDGRVDALRAAAEPAIDGTRAEVSEVFAGIDARVFAQAQGVKTFLIVDAPPKDPSWTFLADLPAGAALRPDPETGGIDIVDDTGTRRMVLPAPYAVDSTPDESTGSGRTTPAVSYRLGEHDGSPTVTISVDDERWLAEAVYPVYVDPSTTIYNEGTNSYGDAHVNQGNASMNYANYQRPDSPYYYEMWLGESPSNSTYYNEAYIKFDLATLAGRSIDAASLEVRPYHQYYDAPTATTTWLRRVVNAGTWTESTIKWSTKPAVNSTPVDTAGCVEGQQCAFAVTSLVRGWIDGTYTNNGVRLDENGNGPTYWKRLIASEQGTSTRPRLIVTYHDPVSVVYPSGGATSSRTLTWAFDAPSTQSSYRVDVASDVGFATIVATSGDLTGAATSWAIPAATSLTPGATYHWRVRVKFGTSAWSPYASASFTYDPAALGLAGHHHYETFDLGGGDGLVVDVSTLNAVVTHPVVSLPYRGGQLELTLTHNGQDTADVGLGRGWQLDASRRIEQATSGTVILVDETGGRHAFIGGTPTGGITPYARPHTLYGVLTKDTTVSPTRFTLTYKDQSKDTFELAGTSARLVRAEDRHGNALTFEYTSGLLTKIKEPANREVVLAWTGTPARLASITDWVAVTGGIVAASGTPNRLHRFFYDGSGRLSGWAAPLNTAGTCPATPTTTVVPHLACLGYDANGYLATISKARTRTTFSAGVLGTAIETATVAIDGAGTGEVRDVRDAAAYPSGSPSTFRRTGSALVEVVRPGTPAATARYALRAPTDDLARVTGISHKLGSVWIEQRTSWSTVFPTEPTSVVDDYVNGVVGDGTSPTVDDRTTSYTYGTTSPDTMGRVVTVSEPLDGTNTRVTEYTYNANHDVTLVKVSQNGTTTPVYTKTCYTTQSNTCATSEAGPSVVRQIDNWVSGGPSTHDANVATDFTSDSFGQRLTATRSNRDSAGALIDARVTAWAYGTSGGALGNVVSETVNVAGSSTYDADPDPATNARTNLRTVHEYDSAGNRIATADPRRAILGAGAGTFDYRTTWTYDAANRQVTEQTPTTPGITITQKTATMVYDELGAVRSATDFGGRVTATRFDLAGRALATYEDPAGTPPAVQTGAATYDAAGRVLTAKDQRQLASSALGETRTIYDELGRATTVTEAAGSTPDAASATVTTYDALDRQTSQTVGGVQTTTYAYDLGGRTIKTDDDFTCTTATFDYRGLAMTETSGLLGGACASGANTRTISHSHDGLARLTRSEVTAGTGTGDRTVDATFDSAGRSLTAAVRTAGVTTTTTFTTNPLDEVVAEARADGSTAKTTYDSAGNPTDRCYWKPGITVGVCNSQGTTPWTNPPTQVTTSVYDARSSRIELRDSATDTVTTYDPDHNYQPLAFYVPTASGREHQTIYGYDARHRLATITQRLCVISSGHNCSSTTATGSNTYAYDDNDNRTTVVEHNGAASTDRRYCYDALNQLRARETGAACTTTSGDETYTYDAAGNRLTAPGQIFIYNATGQLTGCTVTCSTITYDTAGNTARLKGWSYEYDSEGRLVRACKAANCTGSPDKVEFTYDGEGHRTQTREYTAGVLTTTRDFRYQGDAVVEESTNGIVSRGYLVDEADTIIRVCDPSCASPTSSYLVTWNGHGDATALYRINGDGTLTLANSYKYSTWGEPETTTHNGIVDLGFRFLYVGQFDVQWDNFSGLGLIYMHARHYSPLTGRLLQPDPSAAEANHYAYAENSPVTKVDPSGLESWRWTEAERRWCDLNSGWECSMWVLSSAEAIAWAKPLRNPWTENAFRHCIWQCLLAARTSKRKAATWGYIHENSAANVSPTDRTVDLHNNAVGRSLSSEPWAWTLSTAARLCDRAWRSGRLLTVRNGRIQYSDGDRYPRVGGR